MDADAQAKLEMIQQILKENPELIPQVAALIKPAKKERKTKYANEEERIAARRLQQKSYRERKKNELAELKAKVAQTEEQK